MSEYVLSMFGKQPKANARKFEQYVREGECEKWRKDLNGESSKKVARRFQETFGGAWQVSGPIAGDENFGSRILADISSVNSIKNACDGNEKQWRCP